ncbi:MAG: winged helix DNA-binding domain-containing protein, partial [Chloroflexi bacterium]|nr:winged helix DNA-binding domain-containing protein [Chloroflexota bacterium]
MRIPAAGARALLLAAQGLLDPPKRPAAKQDVLSAIRRMEGLQIDTISVVARSPYLVLWSRLGAYETRWLDELLAEGALFEYWSRAACFIPIEDFGLYREKMLERAAALTSPAADSDHADKFGFETRSTTIARVLEQIREGGPVRSADFRQPEKRQGTWWNRKPEKIALEILFNAGALMIARRENMQRVYDLHERVLPGWDDRSVPSKAEAARTLILKALRALGVASPRWISRYFSDALG